MRLAKLTVLCTLAWHLTVLCVIVCDSDRHASGHCDEKKQSGLCGQVEVKLAAA
jgi:hypothetical protein